MHNINRGLQSAKRFVDLSRYRFFFSKEFSKNAREKIIAKRQRGFIPSIKLGPSGEN